MKKQNFSNTLTGAAKGYASMWHEGVIGIPKKGGSHVRVTYQVKVYKTGSSFGINVGRISKLWLAIDGHTVANYDRGWDTEPTCEEAKLALCILLNNYN